MSDGTFRSTRALKRELSSEPGGSLLSTLIGLWPYIWPSNRRHLKLRAAQGGPGDGQAGLRAEVEELEAHAGRVIDGALVVQGAWLANATFAGLGNEADPIVGSREEFPPGQPTDNFTRPRAEGPCARFSGLPRFVTVVGGAYFFLPGLRALRFIARRR